MCPWVCVVLPRWGVGRLWYRWYRCKEFGGESFGVVSPAPSSWVFSADYQPTSRFSAPCTVGGCTANIVGPGTKVPTTETISIYIVGCTVHCIVERDDDRGRMGSAPLTCQGALRVHCSSRMPISTRSSFVDGALGLSPTCAYARAGAIARGRVPSSTTACQEGGGTPARPHPAYHPLEPPRACACVTNKLEAP